MQFFANPMSEDELHFVMCLSDNPAHGEVMTTMKVTEAIKLIQLLQQTCNACLAITPKNISAAA